MLASSSAVQTVLTADSRTFGYTAIRIKRRFRLNHITKEKKIIIYYHDLSPASRNSAGLSMKEPEQARSRCLYESFS